MAALVAAILLVLGPAGGPTASAAGLRMWIPPGWHEVEQRLARCDNPVERLTIAGPAGGLVHLRESLPPLRALRAFPRRPARFLPEGRPEWIACCAPARRPGWLVRFRQNGRAFYAYVYGTTAQAKRDAFTALSSLLVERR
jgi:hypothetical protein